MKQWYEALFENYAKSYENESFTEGTLGECDFIEKEIGFNKRVRILDIGCGTGRHSVELAARGYTVTGLDLSDPMLARAREKAAERGVAPVFLCHDARLPFPVGNFGLAVMLCEGGFPLMETDEMNYAILRNAAESIEAGGKFIFTTLNGLFPLFHSVKDFLASESREGNATYDKNSFDLMTFRDHSVTTVVDDSGIKHDLVCNERYYVPCEITWLLQSCGFRAVNIYGAKLGAFSREDKLTTDDYEMLVVAEK